MVAEYHGHNDELHLAFNFSLLTSPWSASSFGREIARFETALPPGEDWRD